MIAYGYYIDFIPKLKHEKNRSDSFTHTIAVKESPSFNLYEKLHYKMKFINNQGRESSLYSQRDFSRTQKEQLWCYEVEEVVSFYWESGTKMLQYIPHEKFTSGLLEYWALHIAIPLFLTIEETYDFLHAGAVEVDGKPILFVAESFGGKSTMTDYFIKQGHTMVSDDRVAAYEDNGVFFAVSSHPHHRPYRKMEDLGFFVENMDSIPKPIHAIYELEKAEPDALVEIGELHGIEKFKSLRYSSDFNFFFLKTKRFTFLSRLAKAVPVYKVTIPWNMERLAEVYAIICEHSVNRK